MVPRVFGYIISKNYYSHKITLFSVTILLTPLQFSDPLYEYNLLYNFLLVYFNVQSITNKIRGNIRTFLHHTNYKSSKFFSSFIYEENKVT